MYCGPKSIVPTGRDRESGSQPVESSFQGGEAEYEMDHGHHRIQGEGAEALFVPHPGSVQRRDRELFLIEDPRLPAGDGHAADKLSKKYLTMVP